MNLDVLPLLLNPRDADLHATLANVEVAGVHPAGLLRRSRLSARDHDLVRSVACRSVRFRLLFREILFSLATLLLLGDLSLAHFLGFGASERFGTREVCG